MHQGGGVERLARHPAGPLCAREPAQFLVDELPQPPRGIRITLLNGAGDMGNILHEWSPPRDCVRGRAFASPRRAAKRCRRPSPYWTRAVPTRRIVGIVG